MTLDRDTLELVTRRRDVLQSLVDNQIKVCLTDIVSDYNELLNALAAQQEQNAAILDELPTIRAALRKNPLIAMFMDQRFWHAHHVDIIIRYNGENRRYEADWIKDIWRAAIQGMPEQNAGERTVADFVNAQKPMPPDLQQSVDKFCRGQNAAPPWPGYRADYQVIKARAEAAEAQVAALTSMLDQVLSKCKEINADLAARSGKEVTP